MTDIVERLRKTASRGVSVWGALQMEAADAIDTLRARLAQQDAEPWKPDWAAFVEYWAHESHLQTYADRERFRASVKAMIATPQAQPAPAPVVPAWMPIESAPKDDYILLWCPTHIQKGRDAMPFTGRYMSHVPWIIVSSDMAIQKVHPTHWMPLPPPPGSAPAVQPCTSKHVDSQNTPDLTVKQFDRLCDLLPHGASWGDSLTPAIVQGICEMIAATPAVQPLMDTRKLCTCDGAGRGPGRACVVKAGGRLGELWRCAHGIGTQGGEHG
jgi:hypothetical protein